MIRKFNDSAAVECRRFRNGSAAAAPQEYVAVLRGIDWPGEGPSPAIRALGLTSCERGEGVSTVAARLAAAAASYDGNRVLLVDANLAQPGDLDTFNVDPGPGLAEVLRGEVEPLEAIQATHIDNLSVLAAGVGGRSLVRQYDRARLAEIVERLKQEFSLSVFDLPPAGEAASAVGLAKLLDGVLLVLEAERVRCDDAQRVADAMSRGNVRLLGAVLNKRRHYLPHWLDRDP
jgi:capsular exopolysaccharide synthesis family protein